MMILIKNIWLKTGIKNWRWIPNITILCTLTYSTAMYLQEDWTYIQIINKSNRVRTADAFSCVLVLQFVVSIVVLLVLLSLYYLNVVPINLRFHTLTYLYFAQKRRFFKISDGLTNWWADWLTEGRTDQLTDGRTDWRTDGWTDGRMDTPSDHIEMRERI